MVHTPVMPEEALAMLAIRPEGVYLEATTGLVIANDQDAESLEMARRNTAEWAERIRFHHGPFATLPGALAEAGFAKADGLLADLGVSRYQLTEPERGFSFLTDGPLDMRMDRSTGMTE